MNLLTKSLLEDLLDIKKTVAIYGGGFKPPTKGHFNVAELALSELPDIDELKIFVGGGVRDGITQDESIQVWDIYKKYLSPKVSVEPSVAPVKSVLGYAKENPDTKVYWVLGARDGEESDLMDIANRTKTINKYPNLEVKVITSKGGISGTKTRTAIKANNKEQFFHFIPDIEEKEQVWDIVSPVIKESMMDDIKTKFQKFISAIKQEGKETKEAVSLLIKSAKGDIELSDEQKEQIGNQLKDILKTIGLVGIATLPGGFIAAVLIKLFKAEYLVTPSAFVNEVGEANLTPYKWEEVDREGYYVYTRFVTDSETQYDVDIKSTVYFPPGQMEPQPALEIEFTAKLKDAEGSSAKIVVNKGEMYRVMSTIVDIIKKYIKKSKAQAIIYSPSKKSSEENFGTQRDNLYRAFISKAFPGTTFKQSGDYITAILPNMNEGTCGYDTDVATGKKLDTPGGLEEENIISETMTVYRLGEIPYDEESFFVTPDYKTWIKFYPGEEIYKITTNKLYLPLRSKSFLSWDELRSKYNSGEFTDDDVSYINPEESGIQDFEQYEIKPDDIIDLEQINLEEGRKKKPDPKKGTGKKPEGSGRRLYTDEDPKDTVRIKFKTKEDIVDTLNKTSFKAKSHARQSQVINLIHQRVRAAYGKAKDPEVKSRLKRALDYIEKRKEMSKKKTERLRKLKEFEDINEKNGFGGQSRYRAIEKRGDKYYYIQDNPFAPGIRQEFGPYKTKEQAKKKMETFPPAQNYRDIIEDSSELKELVTDTEVICDNCGWEWKIADGGDDLYICHKCGYDNNPEYNSLDVNEGDTYEKMAAKGKQSGNLKQGTVRARLNIPKDEKVPMSKINKEISRLKKMDQDDDKKGVQLGDKNQKYYKALQLAKTLKSTTNINENDPFGLNELARQFVNESLMETWNPEESFVSLSRYMIDNGMNIKPLPKIKVIKDDEQNASDLLGKTAYYNPTEKSITLYTMDRHPKDILRSFAHEMVHHEQNLEGRLDNINTTNTNEDGDLPEIEREAYQKGNMMFRNWEDSIKNV
jgi:hypothetical protein